MIEKLIPREFEIQSPTSIFSPIASIKEKQSDFTKATLLLPKQTLPDRRSSSRYNMIAKEIMARHSKKPISNNLTKQYSSRTERPTSVMSPPAIDQEENSYMREDTNDLISRINKELSENFLKQKILQSEVSSTPDADELWPDDALHFESREVLSNIEKYRSFHNNVIKDYDAKELDKLVPLEQQFLTKAEPKYFSKRSEVSTGSSSSLSESSPEKDNNMHSTSSGTNGENISIQCEIEGPERSLNEIPVKKGRTARKSKVSPNIFRRDSMVKRALRGSNEIIKLYIRQLVKREPLSIRRQIK